MFNNLNKNKHFVVFVFIILICLIFLSFSSIISASAKNTSNSRLFQSGVVFDYVILMDKSRSMANGSPTLLEQLKGHVIDFIESLPPGSNLIGYAFDSEITPIGEWNNITPADKPEIISKFSEVGPPEGGTALWDALCVGLEDLERLAAEEGFHIQMLLSFTDGKDESSKPESKACLDKYKTLYQDGNILWVYNAFAGAEIPEDLNPLLPYIELTQSVSPDTIRLVNVQPFIINGGNIFYTGRIPIESSNIIFWTSDENAIGRVVEIGEPYFEGKPLPAGTTLQVCLEGTDCERTIIISESAQRLDISLLNYDSSRLTSGDIGTYVVHLPLELVQDREEFLVLFPQELVIQFEIKIETSTPGVTNTAPPGIVNFTCQPDLNLGRVSRPEKDEEIYEIICTIDWAPSEINPSVLVEWDLYEGIENPLALEIGPAGNVWFEKDGVPGETLILVPEDDQFVIKVRILDSFWSDLGDKEGFQFFQAPIKITFNDAELFGEGLKDVEFFIVLPIPPGKIALYVLLILLVIFILYAIIRPRFSNKFRMHYLDEDYVLSGRKPNKWKDGSINLGGGDSQFILNEEDDPCAVLYPSWHGSILGKLLRLEKRSKFSIEAAGNGEVYFPDRDEGIGFGDKKISVDVDEPFNVKGNKSHSLTIKFRSVGLEDSGFEWDDEFKDDQYDEEDQFDEYDWNE